MTSAVPGITFTKRKGINIFLLTWWKVRTPVSEAFLPPADFPLPHWSQFSHMLICEPITGKNRIPVVHSPVMTPFLEWRWGQPPLEEWGHLEGAGFYEGGWRNRKCLPQVCQECLQPSKSLRAPRNTESSKKPGLPQSNDLFNLVENLMISEPIHSVIIFGPWQRNVSASLPS